MRVLIDSNVILDVLTKRQPFFDASNNAIEKLICDGNKLYVSASCLTDIYYLLMKAIKDRTKVLEEIKKLVVIMNIAKVDEQCISNAIQSKMLDFEDAVVDSVASSIKAAYILTRNEKDFKNAANAIRTPSQFVGLKEMTPEELKNHYVG